MSDLKTRVARLGVRLAGFPFELQDRQQVVDAIVVLGAPLRPDGNLSLAGRERVEEGVRRWKAGEAKWLHFTGGAAHSAAEAPAMARRARELGVPSEAILVEEESSTTAENARMSRQILQEAGVKRVWIVSQPFHLRRGRRLFRKQGFAAWAHSNQDSVQFLRPDLAYRWVAREYVAWIAHFILPNH